MFGYFFSPVSLIKKKNCDPHHFNMAVTTLVPLAFKNEHNKPYFTTKQNFPTDEPERVAPFSKKLKASGTVNFKQ